MYIIVGLGNPGAKYEHTRHNCGYDALDILAERNRIAIDSRKFKALTGTGYIGGKKALLMKPLTFMNLSGEAVGEAVRFFKEDPATNLIVLYDDISLKPGQLRVRTKGSAGGHNGMKSIIQHLGTEQFLRVKIGTGDRPDDRELADWVLGHVTGDERIVMQEAFEKAADAAGALLTEDAQQVMSEYNKKQ